MVFSLENSIPLPILFHTCIENSLKTLEKCLLHPFLTLPTQISCFSLNLPTHPLTKPCFCLFPCLPLGFLQFLLCWNWGHREKFFSHEEKNFFQCDHKKSREVLSSLVSFASFLLALMAPLEVLVSGHGKYQKKKNSYISVCVTAVFHQFLLFKFAKNLKKNLKNQETVSKGSERVSGSPETKKGLKFI